MNRREFARDAASAAFAAAAGGLPSMAPAWQLERVPASMPFSLSVMLWTVEPKLPFDKRLEMVAEAGYPAAELVHEYKDWTDERFREVHRRKRELELTFDATAGMSRSLCDPAQRGAFLDELKAILVVVDKLECSRLIVLSGNRVPGLSPAEMHRSCVEGLKRAADVAAEKKVELLLENIDPEENPSYFLTSVAEGFEIVREAGHPNVKFLYDFFHEQIAEGNLIEKLEKNIAQVGLLHVADVPGRHEPGTGEICYPNIFRKLGQLGYNRFVAMEFIPTGGVVPALRAAREMALQYGRG